MSSPVPRFSGTALVPVKSMPETMLYGINWTHSVVPPLSGTSRATSSAFRPASVCLTAAIICASVCLLLDIVPRLPEYENRTRFCAENGDQATDSTLAEIAAIKTVKIITFVDFVIARPSVLSRHPKDSRSLRAGGCPGPETAWGREYPYCGVDESLDDGMLADGGTTMSMVLDQTVTLLAVSHG